MRGSFEPFGKDWQAEAGDGSGASENGVFLRLPGQWDDEVWAGTSDEGLHYNLFRWYQVPLGLYSRVDPLAWRHPLFLTGDSYNVYHYSYASPTGFFDQSGLAAYVILVGDPGLTTHNVGSNFRRAADTRRSQLVGQGHQVTVVHVSTLSECNQALTTNGTIDGGVIYYGHGTWNALYVGEGAGAGTNIEPGNVSGLSGANLGPSCTVTLNACFTGSGGAQSIAQSLADQLGRPVTAPDVDLSFSGDPSQYLFRPGEEPPPNGPIYMVPNPNGGYQTFNPTAGQVP